jgi:hypothetical protein
MPRPSSSTLTEPSSCSVTLIFLPKPASASSAALSSTSWMTCSGLSVRVYMPGRCLTGSRPLSTRMEPSEYSLAETEGGLTAMGRIVVRPHVQRWMNTQAWARNPRAGPVYRSPVYRRNGTPESLHSCVCIRTPQKLSMFQVLACGAAIVTLSMGIRHGFGLWLQPITQEMGWTRQSFALAIAIQNLSWGLIGIFVGMVADRFRCLSRARSGAPCCMPWAWRGWPCRPPRRCLP